MLRSAFLIAAMGVCTAYHDAPAKVGVVGDPQAIGLQDCDVLLERAVPILARPIPDGAPDREVFGAFAVGVECELYKDDREAAYRYAVAATKRAHAPDNFWRRRLGLELDTGRLSEAVGTVETLAALHPALLNQIPTSWPMGLSLRIDASGSPALQNRLLQVLTADGYRPTGLTASPDPFRKRYAELLFDRGERERALALARKITDAELQLRLSLDPRFRASFPADFDPRAGFERKLVATLALIKDNPDHLEPLVVAARLMRRLGRHDQAIALLLTVKSPEKYVDASDHLNWWWNALAKSYEATGQYDEAMSAFRNGKDAGERGGGNVSQVINLADSEIHFRKPQSALDGLSRFEATGTHLSPFGAMQLHLAKGCADALLEDRAGAAIEVNYIKAHQADAPDVLGDMLLCEGDMDGAAAVFIAALDDPLQRSDTLLKLCDYDAPSPAAPVSPYDAGLANLKTRPDVRAAIQRAGGTRRIHLQAGD